MVSRLEVLGTSNLKNHDGVRAQSVLQQPRRFALLVYLALATRKAAVRRDTVIAVFWPDSDPARARGALSQALHYLRRSLGRDAIINVDQELLQLDRAAVSCDAVEFLDAVEAGRWREAADLYAGQLLPGFFDSTGAAEFEYWLDDERRSLQEAAGMCAWQLARKAEQDGATPEAIIWGRRACEWTAPDEAGVRRLMSLMARLGDRTGVVEAYERVKHELRLLDAEPSRETQDLLTTLREEWADDAFQQGGEEAVERAAATVPAPASSNDPVTIRSTDAATIGSTDAAARPGDRSIQRRLAPRIRRLRFAGAALLLAVVITTFWGLRRAGHVPVAPPTILVQRLRSDSDAPVASDALGDQIVAQLQSMTSLNVMAGSESGPSPHQSAAFILQGGVVRAGNHLQANILLVDGHSRTTLASRRFERANPDSLATLNELSAAIAEFARQSIGTVQEDRRIAAADVPPTAIHLVLLGRSDREMADSLNNLQTWEAAETSYARADSTFAAAAARAPNWSRPWLERAMTAHHRALNVVQARQGDSSAYQIANDGVTYATAALHRSPGDIQAREVRGLLNLLLAHLAPNDSSAVPVFLTRAANDARRVTSVDPHRAKAWDVLAGVFQTRGDWNEAYWALSRAISEDTYLQDDLEMILNLSYVAWEIDDMAAARQWCNVARRRMGATWPTVFCEMYNQADATDPDTTIVSQARASLATQPEWSKSRAAFDAFAAVVYARAGARAHARYLLETTAGAAAAKTDNVLPFQAWAWLELGDKGKARALLQQYVEASPAIRKGVLRSRRFAALTSADGPVPDVARHVPVRIVP